MGCHFLLHPTRDQTRVPCIERLVHNHWTTEKPLSFLTCSSEASHPEREISVPCPPHAFFSLFLKVIVCQCFPFKVQFEISITANKCPNKNSETIKIKPLGFTEEVEIILQFICECECQGEGIPGSPKCHDGNGTFECGACR